MDDVKAIFTVEFLKKTIRNPLSVFDNPFVRYVTIGLTTFALDFAIYQFFISILHFQEIISNLMSVLLSLFYNFTLTNYWTFQNKSAVEKSKIAKYTGVAVFNYFFNNAMFILLTHVFDLDGLIAKVIITAMIVSWNYLIYKFWIFKE